MVFQNKVEEELCPNLGGEVPLSEGRKPQMQWVVCQVRNLVARELATSKSHKTKGLLMGEAVREKKGWEAANPRPGKKKRGVTHLGQRK